MIDFYLFSVCFFLLLTAGSVSGQSIVDNGDITFISRAVNCSLTANEENSCETCLKKGDDCFWCGGRTKKCMHYEWYFPNCDLDHVKHKQCWVNWTALIVVVSVICGIVLVILITVFCCCICKCKECNRQRRKKAFTKRENKEQARRDDLATRQMERSSKRQEEMQYYRDKYGIPAKDAGPLPKKEPLP